MNLNPWQNLHKMCFLRNLHKNPQEKLKVIVMARLAKVGAEPELVPRLAGGGSAPEDNT